MLAANKYRNELQQVDIHGGQIQTESNPYSFLLAALIMCVADY